ncbi:PadR family transcriptional regulator [Streptomyces sp. NBC_00237]|uniref:PadR family transcriptional regulator n=1 Tax=Streptomyces sp. NBC_00237 TaxID=2975687 RepID=UPI00224F356C|nr:PadR family transcriptional regulator [Streptomyces sp. NBC_00237]MCX5202441.1 PadR family transcriptional regulator [Streptomyces sp. NBC_00237]
MTDTPPQVGVPTVLRVLAKQPATAFELVEATCITGPTIRRALDRLVREGWATCEEGPVGPWGRRRKYTITQAGREQIARTDSTEDQ